MYPTIFVQIELLEVLEHELGKIRIVVEYSASSSRQTKDNRGCRTSDALDRRTARKVDLVLSHVVLQELQVLLGAQRAEELYAASQLRKDGCAIRRVASSLPSILEASGIRDTSGTRLRL